MMYVACLFSGEIYLNDLSGKYMKFIGASPEPRKLLKKLDQNFSCGKYIKSFWRSLFSKREQKGFLTNAE